MNLAGSERGFAVRDPDAISAGPSGDEDIEDELLSSCRELSLGFTALDHLRLGEPGQGVDRLHQEQWPPFSPRPPDLGNPP